MITMEFDEMKKIWDTQNNQPLYAINEDALHKRILTKKNQARHISNTSELLAIFVNMGGGSLVLEKSVTKGSDNISIYILGGWMLCLGLYFLVNRIRRIRESKRFDRSMKGELNHAISAATYQVSLSRLMRWNTIPIGILLLISLWLGGKPLWMSGLVFLLVPLLYYLSGFEHNFYLRRKHELESLQSKLDSETPAEAPSA